MGQKILYGLCTILVLILISGSTVAAPVDGEVDILSSQTRTHVFPCAAKGCSLKEFTIQVDTYRVHLPGEVTSYGTRMYSRYDTGNTDELEKYGIAQFVRGCQYTSMLDNAGEVTKSEDISIDIGGQIMDYRFRDFITDGFVRDPLDWGDDPQNSSRHFFYQWNRVPGSFDPTTREWYGLTKPTNAALYVSDHPGTAFYSPTGRTARNVSVEFKTCLYLTEDVPRDIDPRNVNFAKPLSCFKWSSSFIYNFKTGEMDSPSGLDPFCLEPGK